MRSIRSCKWVLLCLAFAMPLAQAGTNSWTVNGPFGGLVTDVLFQPGSSSVAYASSQASIFRSADGGATWSMAKEDFGTFEVTDLEQDPLTPGGFYVAAKGQGVFHTNDGATFKLLKAVGTPLGPNQDRPVAVAAAANGTRLYYLAVSGRFFRSNDAGANWVEAAHVFSQYVPLVVDPANPDVVYAGMNKSVNGGDSWTSFTAGNVFGLVFVPGTPSTLWLSERGGIRYTTDGGAHWTASLSVNAAGPLARDPNDPAGLIAALDDQTVWRFAAGAWSQLPAIYPGKITGASAVAIAPGNPNRMLIASQRGIQRSENNGVSWVASNTGITGTTAQSMTAAAGRVYAGTDSGTIAYADDEGGWHESGLPAVSATSQAPTFIGGIAVHPTNPLSLLFAADLDGVYRSADGGLTWSNPSNPPNLITPLLIQELVLDPLDPATVYATVDAHNQQSAPAYDVIKSTDGGVTFNPASTGRLFLIPSKLSVDPHNTQRLYLASFGPTSGLFRSANGGASWGASLLPDLIPVFDVAIDPADEGRVYAATGDDGLQVSDDGGDAWSVMASFAPYASPRQIEVDPSNPNTLYAVSVDGSTAPVRTWYVMRSVDRGQSWERIPNRFENSWVPLRLALHPTRPSLLFLGVNLRGVHTLEIKPDLSVAIVDHSGNRPLSVASTFDVALGNQGPFAATSVQLHVDVPATLQNVSATIEGQACTIATGSIQCSLPYLKTNAQATAHVQYTAATAGALAVHAAVSSAERDSAMANNGADASASVAEIADLGITATGTTATVTQGQAATLALQVKNNGPSPASSARLDLAVASGLTLSGSLPAGCAVASGGVSCTLGALANGQSVSFSFSATAGGSGTLHSVATLNGASATTDPSAANNTLSVDITSNAVAAPPSGGGGGGGGGAFSWLWLGLLAALSGLRGSASGKPASAV